MATSSKEGNVENGHREREIEDDQKIEKRRRYRREQDHQYPNHPSDEEEIVVIGEKTLEHQAGALAFML